MAEPFGLAVAAAKECQSVRTATIWPVPPDERREFHGWFLVYGRDGTLVTARNSGDRLMQ